jgi:DNA (cytosine-5)-methyltransferase 1
MSNASMIWSMMVSVCPALAWMVSLIIWPSSISKSLIATSCCNFGKSVVEIGNRQPYKFAIHSLLIGVCRMSRAYYNEIDPYCAQWLRNLIAAKLIAPGDVDERDIRDIAPNELVSYTQCHFFAGIGGWSHALRLAGIGDDVPLWTGSCPCQPFSQAGKRRGFADERHLWPHWFHLISVFRPAIVLGEQVAKAADWLRLVRGDLEGVGYAVGAMPVEAASAGADQLRDRFWFVADDGSRRRDGSGEWQVKQSRRTEVERASTVGRSSSSPRLAFGSQPEIFGGDVRNQGATACEAGDRSGELGQPTFGNANQHALLRAGPSHQSETSGAGSDAHEWVLGADGKARRVKPGICLLAHDVPARVDKLRAFGNAIVPQCAAQFIRAALG